MPDHDPLLLRRLLELRRFPLLAAAELAELAMVAENVVPASYGGGELVEAPPGPDAIHLILSGRIDAGAEAHEAHEAFGLLHALARRPLEAPAVAVGETRTLRLAAPDLREVLEDSFGLLAIAIRELARRTLAARAAPPRPLPRPASFASPLGLVERMIVLRHQVPFAFATSRELVPDWSGRAAPLEAIALLAHTSKETTWPAGAVMARCGEPARDARFLLEGSVLVTRPGGDPILLGPGGAIGVIEGLAGVPHAAAVEVVAPVRALEICGSVVFDVLEDHTDLGLAMLEALAGGLLGAGAAR